MDLQTTPMARSASPLPMPISRRGTVADVRSLGRSFDRVVIEGPLLRRRGRDLTSMWFQLDQKSPDLCGFAARPSGPDVPLLLSVPMDEVAEVVRVKGKTEFQLCDASHGLLVHLVADDDSTLLWWLHGLQRRIFAQAKGEINARAPQSPQRLRFTTMRPLAVRPRSVSPAPAQWLELVVAAQQGRRRTMEDETVVELHVNDKYGLPMETHGHLAVVAIFDGHAGRECAEYAAEFLLDNTVQCEAFKQGNMEAALRSSFVQTDREFREWAVENECISGSTAIVVLVRDQTLYVANCGDSRAVLCRAGKAVELSHDHKPSRPDERARVERAGGWVEDNEVLNIPKLHAMGLENRELLDEEESLVGWVVVSKVMGALGMTRSLGDTLIKDHLESNFESALEGGRFVGELVLADPEVHVEAVQRGDAFVVVACDGLWDVFSSQEACLFVQEQLDEGVERRLIGDLLIARALRMGSLDNVSCVIVFLDHERSDAKKQ